LFVPQNWYSEMDISAMVHMKATLTKGLIQLN